MPDDAHAWHANLLGATRIEGPFGSVERLRTRTAFALVAFLLLNRTRAYSRDELADRFWPDDEPEAARGKLRLALHSTRAALGDLLDADRHAVRIAHPEGVTSDRDEFRRLLAGEPEEARLARAIELYRGPFMPGFYDDWAVEERDRLETEIGGALRRLAEGHARAERWPLALDAASRLVALEPYDEAAHVLVLRSLRALGRREALIRTLEWTRERFAELGSRPGEAIEAFAQMPAPSEADDEGESAFLGREADLALVLKEMAAGGVVTLWGPPGVGKTRLAREAVRALGSHAAFVSAVGVESVEALVNVLRPVLGGGAFGRLADRAEGLVPRQMVIDNVESLPDEGVALLGELRERNPGLRFLLTSQRRTGLPEEVVVALAPLGVPPEGATAAQVAASVSVRLLRDRTRERGRRLRVDEGNAAALGALCRRLEGVPLALELAAEWLDVLGPAEILARLDESGRRLDARLPGRDPRHRSLETAIAASLGRLDERLRRAVRSLAVFLGGWDLAAAEAVLEGEDAAGVLSELESRALVKVESAGGRVRYGMLESIRILVSAATPPEERAAALRRHAEHFAAVGTAMQADATSLVEAHRADDENVRLAAETILATEPDPERAATQIGGFQGYWQKLGRWELAETTLRRALDRLPPTPSKIKASLYNWLDYVGFGKDDLALCEWCGTRTQGVLLALGDANRAQRCDGNIGYTLAGRGDFEGAIPRLRSYLDVAQGQNPGFHGGDLVYATLILGETLSNAGHDEEGWARLQESLRLGSEAEAHQRMGASCSALGWHLRLRGRSAEAEPYLRRAVELLADSEEPFRAPTANARRAIALADLGDVAGARAALGDAIRLAAALGRADGYADAAEAGAWTAHAAGQPAVAAYLLGASRTWRRRTRALSPLHVARLEGLEAALRSGRFGHETLRGETASRAEIAETIRRVANADGQT